MNELPEKWAIKGHYSISKVLKQYFQSINKDKYNWNFNYAIFYYIGKYNADSNSFLPNDYTEISFETFERLVLGINKEKHYELW
jgi:hypothetical protein